MPNQKGGKPPLPKGGKELNPKGRKELKSIRAKFEKAAKKELFRPDPLKKVMKKEILHFDRFLIFDLAKSPGEKGYNPILEVKQ